MKTLAVSVGSRTSGLAIVEGRELIVKEILHTNRTTHSHSRRLAHYLKQYDIEVVIIKLPPQTHITDMLRGVIERIYNECATARCTVKYTTDKEIKRMSEALVNKYAIIEFVTERYPDLLPEKKKEAANKTKYYIKIFEAVLAAHQYQLSQYTTN